MFQVPRLYLTVFAKLTLRVSRLREALQCRPGAGFTTVLTTDTAPGPGSHHRPHTHDTPTHSTKSHALGLWHCRRAEPHCSKSGGCLLSMQLRIRLGSHVETGSQSRTSHKAGCAAEMHWRRDTPFSWQKSWADDPIRPWIFAKVYEKGARQEFVGSFEDERPTVRRWMRNNVSEKHTPIPLIWMRLLRAKGRV
jgi:hypothetical protein